MTPAALKVFGNAFDRARERRDEARRDAGIHLELALDHSGDFLAEIHENIARKHASDSRLAARLATAYARAMVVR